MKNESFEKSFCPDWCPKKHTDCNYECEDPAFRKNIGANQTAECEMQESLYRPIRTHTIFLRKFRI
jgi:hypothetical protein